MDPIQFVEILVGCVLLASYLIYRHYQGRNAPSVAEVADKVASAIEQGAEKMQKPGEQPPVLSDEDRKRLIEYVTIAGVSSKAIAEIIVQMAGVDHVVKTVKFNLAGQGNDPVKGAFIRIGPHRYYIRPNCIDRVTQKGLPVYVYYKGICEPRERKCNVNLEDLMSKPSATDTVHFSWVVDSFLSGDFVKQALAALHVQEKLKLREMAIFILIGAFIGYAVYPSVAPLIPGYKAPSSTPINNGTFTSTNANGQTIQCVNYVCSIVKPGAGTNSTGTKTGG